MNIAPINEPNTMIPATAATQKIGRAAIFKSYSGFAARFCRMTKPMSAATATSPSPIAAIWASGTTMKLIDRINAPTSTAESTPPRLSTGSDVSFTCAGMQAHGEREADRDQRERHEEHRAPPVVLEQDAGDEGAERGDRAPGGRPQRDRLGPAGSGRPERGDERQGGGVRHPGGESTDDASEDQHLDRPRPRGEQARRKRDRDAEQQHRLAAVPVTERAEPQHRRGESERVPDRDQVQLGLRRVEVETDVGEGNVGDGERKVRDRRDDDQRPEHRTRALRAPVTPLIHRRSPPKARPFCGRRLTETTCEEITPSGRYVRVADLGHDPAMNAATTPTKKRRLPVLQGVLPIERKRIPFEVAAGITLAALGIPETMGYATIAGMPVITGLYTILIPIAIFALLGSSRHLVVGADSATAAIMAAGLAGMAPIASPEYVTLAGMLAIITGVILIVARLVKLGFIADFLSRSVLIGFLTGVGIQVAMGQVGGMLGIPTPTYTKWVDGSSGTVEKFVKTLGDIGDANTATVWVSVAVIAVILGSKKINPRIPGALIAVIGSIAVSEHWDLSSDGVSTLGKVPSGLPNFGIPDVTWSQFTALLATAGAIFVVILAQSAATSRVRTRPSTRIRSTRTSTSSASGWPTLLPGSRARSW